MIKTSYDPEADAFYARFAPETTEISETREAAPGVMLDLDANGNLVGLEVLNIRVRLHTASEPSFATIWNNPDDAAYDAL